METIWFGIIAVMLATYVALDGFDFGVGILHLFVAKTDEERRTTLSAIGPVWDGNEVWLLSSGGILVFAFPKVYASGFSGFYMPLTIVLWLLILRGISIEFRSKEPNRLWREFWDATFFFSSTLMAIVLGAALGNVVRGVSLGASGYFATPLFTTFAPGTNPGVLDWYTVSMGLFTLATLAGHGALYLIWKTEGEVQRRARNLAIPLWGATILLFVVISVGTFAIRPTFYTTLLQRPLAWVTTIGVVASLACIFWSLSKRKELAAFLGSAGFIVSLLAATAIAHYPNLLTSSINSTYNLTIYNSAAGTVNLQTGLIWWLIAITLAVCYFVFLFRSFRGKAKPSSDEHGY